MNTAKHTHITRMNVFVYTVPVKSLDLFSHDVSKLLIGTVCVILCLRAGVRLPWQVTESSASSNPWSHWHRKEPMRLKHWCWQGLFTSHSFKSEGETKQLVFTHHCALTSTGDSGCTCQSHIVQEPNITLLGMLFCSLIIAIAV